MIMRHSIGTGMLAAHAILGQIGQTPNKVSAKAKVMALDSLLEHQMLK